MKIGTFISAYILALMVVCSPLLAQQSVQSVMTVQAEVISGSQVSENLFANLSEQLTTFESNESVRPVEIGSISIRVPEGVVYIATYEHIVRMQSRESEFDLVVNSEKGRVIDGASSTYFLTGTVHTGEILAGAYHGEAKTVIEYE